MMMRRFLIAGVVTLVAALSGCGGGGDAGCSGFTSSSSCSGGGGTTQTLGDMTLVLSSNAVANNGSDKIGVTVTTVDTDRRTISGVAVQVSVDANATVSLTSTSSDTKGEVIGSVSIGADRSDRLVTVTAKSGTITRTATFAVKGTKIGATLANSVQPGSTGNVISYRVTDVNSTAMPGQAYTVSAPGLPSANGVTDSNGAFTYTYTAPSAAGSLKVTVVAAGVSQDSLIQVESIGQGGGDPAVGPVVAQDVSVNPNTVSANSANSTTSQAIVRALFVGPNNRPIPNLRVRFRLDDINNVGGSLATTTVLKTDANGVASTSYIPGVLSSPTNGVQITACYSLTDFVAPACPQSVATTLTVTAEPVSVTIGTNNVLEEGDKKLTYIKNYVVSVVDSSGKPKAGVQISPQIVLTDFIKGRWFPTTDGWALPTKTVNSIVVLDVLACPNEDVNLNSKLDAGEDTNGSGSLEPAAASVVISSGSSVTNANGLAYIQMEYPKNVASWIAYRIEVSATGIGGTEGSSKYVGILPTLAADISDAKVVPPFAFSPYGYLDRTSSGCTNTN